MDNGELEQLADVTEYSITVPALKLAEVDLVYSTPGPGLSGPAAAADILAHYIADKPNEHFAALYLNARNEVTHYRLVSVGSLVTSIVHPREVYQAALMTNSASIICGHNHPSGNTNPSSEDRLVFDRLGAAGDLLGVKLLDFLIVSPTGDYYSFVERGEESRLTESDGSG